MIDRDKYFDGVRAYPFGGSMTQSQVDGQSFILDAWEEFRYGDDLRWLAYFLATSYHETAGEMQPIEEYGKGGDAEYAQPDPETGECYYGRGFVQLTWADNYKWADSEFDWTDDESCYLHPELQLDATVAAKTGYIGMVKGKFRPPNKLETYFSDQADDPYGAREIINGDKHTVPAWSDGVSIGKLIEGYYDAFHEALASAWVDDGPRPPRPGKRYIYTISLSSMTPIEIKVTSDDDLEVRETREESGDE